MVLLFIPQLIQEIFDFKSWVLGYLKIDLDHRKVLIRHIDMHLFFMHIFLGGDAIQGVAN
jgi:hypothetical protein